MITTLLQTKLNPPIIRRSLVSRPRLFEKLSQGLKAGERVVLVSAPAGFGKTTLISEWTRGINLPLAWLTLDESDNEPVQFWRYIAGTLNAVDQRIGEGIVTALSSAQPPPIHTLIADLINELEAVNQALILVLDEYHLIEQVDIHEMFSYFLDHQPVNLHVVIATRSDPPLQLARRRARGELCEVRAADLRFNQAEVVQFINQVMQLDLSEADISSLEERTEGWIAGLQMAVISLQDVTDRQAFIALFRGDDRYIADYLMEEVLQRQPVEFQQFLLQTSLLNQMNAPICNAITGRSDSQAVLNSLERANLFIIPLDNRREWFRYHPLFASLLRQRLRETTDTQTIRQLLHKACDWYANQGLPEQAAECALSSGDPDEIADRLEAASGLMFVRNEYKLLLRWSNSLPDHILRSRLALCSSLAWAANATSEPPAAQRFLTILEQIAGKSVEEFASWQNPEAEAENLNPESLSAIIVASVISSSLSNMQFNTSRTLRLGYQVLPFLVKERDRLPNAFTPPSMLRAPQLFILGMARGMDGELAIASETLQQAAELASESHNIPVNILSLGHLGEMYHLQGHLRLAEGAFQQAIDRARQLPLQALPFTSLSEAGLGQLALERNQLDQAMEFFKAALEHNRFWSSWESLLPTYQGLARLRWISGDVQGANASLDELDNRSSNPRIKPLVDTTRALLHIRLGHLEEAERWLDGIDQNSPQTYLLAWESELLVATRLRLAQDDPDRALKLLEILLPAAQRAGRVGRLIEMLTLQALALGAKAKQSAAFEALTRALNLARDEGYLRLFLDEGNALQRLLRSYQNECEAGLRSYVDHLLDQFDSGEKKPMPSGVAETLTGRELEVLKLMAEGLSNAQISGKLYLTTNTLKAHTHRIYGKLGVHGRMQAVLRARELGILDDA